MKLHFNRQFKDQLATNTSVNARINDEIILRGNKPAKQILAFIK